MTATAPAGDEPKLPPGETALGAFLAARAGEPMEVEDLLELTLPLLRLCHDAHNQGKVAPLDGGRLLAIGAEGQLLFFPGQELEPRQAEGLLHQLDPRHQGALEIVAEREVEHVLGEGAFARDLELAAPVDSDVEPARRRPAFMVGFRSWEIALGHHDPLTDVFLLGQILAALALGLDFYDREPLQRFVTHRGNLFRLHPGLHPLLAKLIRNMTELSRHRRAQDLGAICQQLERWRLEEQPDDLDFRNLPGFRERPLEDRRQISLARLQERLFNLSRHNRLLHFKPTLGSLDLTLASVPLRLDPRRLPTGAIFCWSEELGRDLAAGKPIRLAEKLRFSDHAYLPSLLDRIGADARRDLAEFGFSQLQLVVAFLRWSNLKSPEHERYDSPLLLLPCRLEKKKGIRDSYQLLPQDDELAINPVLRYLLRRLYGIELPQSIELDAGQVDRLFELLTRQIAAAGEKGISLEKIAKPQVTLIHQKARRRLDQYQRRLRLPKGASAGDYDYSYDPEDWRPLGIQLFKRLVQPLAAPIELLLGQDTPAQPSSFGPERTQQVVEIGPRQGQAPAGNAYRWEFDLCALTLANLRDRRMTLVRDYETLVENNPPCAPFDTLFSADPKPLPAEILPAPLEQTWPVLPLDPTQERALVAVRSGASWIVQGPPGTGKSQTIANLIADGAAQGRKILFVCQKRAAIDVVYRRLEQVGLESLLCLVHDSQTDKKSVIQDFKATYERFLESPPEPWKHEEHRQRQLDKVQDTLAPLAGLEALFCAVHPKAGIPLGDLLQKVLDAPPPALESSLAARLPAYNLLREHSDTLSRLRRRLTALRPDGVFARHALAALHPRLIGLENPQLEIPRRLGELRRQHEEIAAAMARLGFPADGDLAEWSTWTSLGLITRSLSEAGLATLLDPESPLSIRLAEGRSQLRELEKQHTRARRATLFWRASWSLLDVEKALVAARTFEGRTFAFLQTSWWRLRKALHTAYDFSQHPVAPSWVDVLEARRLELALAEELAETEALLRSQLRFSGPFAELEAAVEAGRYAWNRLPVQRRPPAGNHFGESFDACLAALGRLDAVTAELKEGCEALLLEPPGRPDELAKLLAHLHESLRELPAFLPCLELLAGLPSPLQLAIAHLPLALDELESACAAATADALLDASPDLRRRLGPARLEMLHQLGEAIALWRRHNAAAIVEKVAAEFRRLCALVGSPAAQLSPAEKELKKRVAQGRRLLEREFEKTMRFRAIRELLTEAGDVVLAMKPVFLMSPLSVADTLPLLEEKFDLVIFDEASQIPLEEAVPSIFRAPQVLVVGDPMQLPPTRFFASKRDEELMPEEAADVAVGAAAGVAPEEIDESLLTYAAKSLPFLFLGWHYRSRSESLIAFSNAAFYQGRLLTIPDARIGNEARGELRFPVAAIPGLTDLGEKSPAAELLRRSISFHRLEGALYAERRNAAEALYIAHLVRDLLRRDLGLSLAIVAFSEAQQQEIEAALESLAAADDDFAERLEKEWEREEDGQFVGLLVRNLENIQGDERDVVIHSVCYAADARGKMRMNFGPINQGGGERRLNVAFSRAKHHMAVISSIDGETITNTWSDGALALRNYLCYAAALSAGRSAEAERILGRITEAGARQDNKADTTPHPLAGIVAQRLAERGYLTRQDLGHSRFRCDLAVRRADETRHRLAILIDRATPEPLRPEELLARDLLRPTLLRQLGWKVCHLSSLDWYLRPEESLEEMIATLES